MFSSLKYLVVGCGFSGAVFAERIASVLGEKVLIIEERNHIGGNSWSEKDPETGIECHKYGSHIFHTSNCKVWEYISKFGDFTGYRHRVLTNCRNKVYSMPINLHTINAFTGTTYSPREAAAFIAGETSKANIKTPRNLEEKAISLIGRELYEAFIKNYTIKQWGIHPAELPESIINRLPVRTTYNTDYFDDLWQGVPRKGYFSLFRNMLSSPKIEIRTGIRYEDIRQEIPRDCKIIFTGMIDSFFDCRFGQLDWRSLKFEWETLQLQDFQGTSVMNYADLSVPYTRIHEFKHYHPERTEVFTSKQTVICREFPDTYAAGKNAYYPVNDEKNNRLFARYREECAQLPNVIFAGRLGSYKYLNMDQAIAQALELFDSKLVC